MHFSTQKWLKSLISFSVSYFFLYLWYITLLNKQYWLSKTPPTSKKHYTPFTLSVKVFLFLFSFFFGLRRLHQGGDRGPNGNSISFLWELHEEWAKYDGGKHAWVVGSAGVWLFMKVWAPSPQGCKPCQRDHNKLSSVPPGAKVLCWCWDHRKTEMLSDATL